MAYLNFKFKFHFKFMEGNADVWQDDEDAKKVAQMEALQRVQVRLEACLYEVAS